MKKGKSRKEEILFREQVSLGATQFLLLFRRNETVLWATWINNNHQ